MQLDSSSVEPSETGVFPEVDIYLSLLVILRLIDNSSLPSVSLLSVYSPTLTITGSRVSI